MNKLLIVILFQLFAQPNWGKAPAFTAKELQKVPPRIIRTCCAFGTDLKMVGIPLVRYSEVGDPTQIGAHVYLGDNTENNGILYTINGGFIDLGHLRDIADWTAFLYATIDQHKGEPYELKLGYEGGKKSLALNIPDDISQSDALQIAGNIAFQLSLWHEISTWFGASSIPMIKERYSSFSIEDNYSNLLGVLLAIDAIKSELDYETAMTQLLSKKLEELVVLPTFEDQIKAMRNADNVFFTSSRRIPSGKILLLHNFQNEDQLQPYLLKEYPSSTPETLKVPMILETSSCLASDYYAFNIRTNRKTSKTKLENQKKPFKNISQVDFPQLICIAETQIDAKYNKERISTVNQNRYERKQKRNEKLKY